eukprot:1184291-Prorocentrum_minimum.AAC.3
MPLRNRHQVAEQLKSPPRRGSLPRFARGSLGTHDLRSVCLVEAPNKPRPLFFQLHTHKRRISIRMPTCLSSRSKNRRKKNMRCQVSRSRTCCNPPWACCVLVALPAGETARRLQHSTLSYFHNAYYANSSFRRAPRVHPS